MLPAIVVVRHIRRDTTRGTRMERRVQADSVPLRKALISECPHLRRSIRKAARPIPANKRTVEWFPLASLSRCLRHTHLAVVEVRQLHEQVARQSRSDLFTQTGAESLPTILRSSERKGLNALPGRH